LERLVYRVRRALLEAQVLRAKLVHRDPRVFKVCRAIPDYRVLRVKLDLPVRRGCRVLRDCRGHRDLLVSKAFRVTPV